MPAHLDTGRRGEEIAAEWLVRKGYEVVARNYRAGRGEIDLIVRKDALLVFVEVKTRTNLAFGMPEQSVSARKAALITKAAEEYTFAADWQGNIRFDIIAVVTGRNPVQVEHFEDAFY
ncbi:MAG: YraN family protein [Cytophagaceae bacterium]|nr:YraN family protein [Cytophagaceae bacterium]